MASIETRFPLNTPGAFYVDEQCIDCDLCRERIPEIFHRFDEGGHSFVGRQPESSTEVEACLAALEDCPVEAIGNDGDQF